MWAAGEPHPNRDSVEWQDWRKWRGKVYIHTPHPYVHLYLRFQRFEDAETNRATWPGAKKCRTEAMIQRAYGTIGPLTSPSARELSGLPMRPVATVDRMTSEIVISP